MKRYIPLAALCVGLSLSAAHAAPFTNEDAVKEAEAKLTSCDNVPTEQDCPATRSRFIEEYQNAYAGDRMAQGRIAYDLWKGGKKESDPPYRQDDVQSCAWKIISIEKPYKADQTEIDVKDQMCDNDFHLEPRKSLHSKSTIFIHAQKLIEQIRPLIRAHTVHKVDVPEIDFKVSRDHDEDHAGDN